MKYVTIIVGCNTLYTVCKKPTGRQQRAIERQKTTSTGLARVRLFYSATHARHFQVVPPLPTFYLFIDIGSKWHGGMQ